MEEISRITRRRFISNTGKTAAAASEDNPVKVGQIGIGTRGMNLVRVAGSKKSCKVVAVCDVYKPHADRGLELCNNPEAKAYTDYKEMLNDPEIEAVIIVTPDHWHDIISIDALVVAL